MGRAKGGGGVEVGKGGEDVEEGGGGTLLCDPSHDLFDVT